MRRTKELYTTEWWVFDNLEMVMGPYLTKEEAEADMKMHIDELYLLEYYPNPYVDYLEIEE